MKKFLRRVLGLVTLATVVPVSINRDEETGKTTYQSLLASLTVRRGQDGTPTDVALDMGEGVLTHAINDMILAQQEAAMFADEELIVVSPAVPAEEPEATEAEASETTPAE